MVKSNWEEAFEPRSMNDGKIIKDPEEELPQERRTPTERKEEEGKPEESSRRPNYNSYPCTTGAACVAASGRLGKSILGEDLP